MDNYWSYGRIRVIEYSFKNRIDANSLIEIIDRVNNLFVDLFDRYGMYKVSDLVALYKNEDNSKIWISSNTNSKIIRCFNWNDWMIENKYVSIQDLNELKLFQLFYFENKKLVRSEFDIMEWEIFLKKLPFPNHRYKDLSTWYSEMYYLPIDFRSNSYSMDTLLIESEIDLYISLTSIYNLWFQKVIYFPNGDAVEKDNYLIALYNASRFNSILKELLWRLGELGFTNSYWITKENEKYVTPNGILIDNKIIYWEDVMEDALAVPLVEFRNNNLNSEQ